MIQRIIQGYKYLFYKLYISLEKYSSPRFWSEWKAASLLTLIIYSIFQSLIIYYEIYINRYSSLGNNYFVIFGFTTFVFILNYYLFMKDDKWKEVVKEFDKIPKKKNQIGTILCCVFFLLCILNIIYAFYLLSQIDWSLYK